MEKKVLFVVVVIISSFVLPAVYGLDTVKDEESKQSSAQKNTATKVAEPKTVTTKAAVTKAVALKAAATKTVTSKAATTKATATKVVAPKAAVTKAITPKAVMTKAAATKAVAPKTSTTKAVAPKAVAPKAQPKGMEMTKEGMMAELKESLAGTNDVLSIIPELKTAIDRDGKVVYTYGGVALENLSKEDMIKLLSKVRQALVKIRTDRIQRQMETTRQVERFQNAANVQQPPRVPTAAPSVPKPPPSLPPAPRRR